MAEIFIVIKNLRHEFVKQEIVSLLSLKQKIYVNPKTFLKKRPRSKTEICIYNIHGILAKKSKFKKKIVEPTVFEISI